MTEAPDKVTIRTVAALAGVSLTTVSRVLNGKADTISAETRERVLETARQLDYRPNRLGVNLRKGVTLTVGLVIPDITSSYFHLVARAVEDAAQAAGYTVILCNTDRNPRKERLYVDVLLEKRVDAIIFAGGGVDNDEHLRDCRWGDTKVVAIGPHHLPCPTVSFDQRAFTQAAVSHLIQQGCRRIACLGGQQNWLINQVRAVGFRDGLAAAGLETIHELIWPGDLTISAGARAVRAALEAGMRFDGIVSFSDYSAIGALRAVKEAGLHMPGDVAIIGCDDIEMASYVEPPLSSVALPSYEASTQAMQMVLDMTRGEEVPEVVEYPFELKARASSLRAHDDKDTPNP